MNRKKMIDTIILTIPREQIRMLSPDGRYIPAWDLHSKTSNYTKYVKNPTPYDRKNEIYRPRLTGVKRRVRGNFYSSFLKIEFSVPKLIFGNNLNELGESDFSKVLSTLKERLIEVGVLISDKDISEVLKSVDVHICAGHCQTLSEAIMMGVFAIGFLQQVVSVPINSTWAYK